MTIFCANIASLEVELSSSAILFTVGFCKSPKLSIKIEFTLKHSVRCNSFYQ